MFSRCRELARSAEDTVVDVGCGTGGIKSKFAASCGAEVIATDVNANAIASVEKALRSSRARAYRAIVSDSNPLPLPDGIASKVICSEVLEHVDDPRQLLAELVRIGKPLARYLISVPDPVCESLQQVLAPPCYWEKPHHLRVFERHEFEHLVQESGLVVEERPPHFFYWSMWWILFWGTEGHHTIGDDEEEEPVLDYWNKTWHALLTNPKADRVVKALNEFMPKSQVVVARKAA